MSGPSKKQRKALGKYARWMANELELRDWTVTLIYDPPANEGAHATINCIYGRKIANISMSRDFFERTPEVQRHVITHELLHCHTSGLDWQFNNIGNQVSPGVFDVMQCSLRDQVEFATDALASAVAKHLPLPEIPARKAKA